MLPQFSPRTKSTAMLFFLATLSLIVLKGVSYNNLIESTESSFFGIQGYGVILVILLLVCYNSSICAFKNKKFNQCLYIWFWCFAIIATYFVGGNTFIPDDTSIYQPRIISELNIGDLSQIKYEGTKRFFTILSNSIFSSSF